MGRPLQETNRGRGVLVRDRPRPELRGVHLHRRLASLRPIRYTGTGSSALEPRCFVSRHLGSEADPAVVADV